MFSKTGRGKLGPTTVMDAMNLRRGGLFSLEIGDRTDVITGMYNRDVITGNYKMVFEENIFDSGPIWF